MASSGGRHGACGGDARGADGALPRRAPMETATGQRALEDGQGAAPAVVLELSLEGELTARGLLRKAGHSSVVRQLWSMVIEAMNAPLAAAWVGVTGLVAGVLSRDQVLAGIGRAVELWRTPPGIQVWSECRRWLGKYNCLLDLHMDNYCRRMSASCSHHARLGNNCKCQLHLLRFEATLSELRSDPGVWDQIPRVALVQEVPANVCMDPVLEQLVHHAELWCRALQRVCDICEIRGVAQNLVYTSD
eukprot:TRINITY_DN19794_c0_g1_i1.p1 TRINITY_DN19794_c0_g1~~TRINITY_DN19794_c0_g1_i1.p1  ORF type:complete len:247 (+),score=24.96 TRINITY_DN19794_c0_g1_i1:165-905(+)